MAGLGAGNHSEPTVLDDCRQDMEMIPKEIFGPVLPVMTFSDLDEAIAFANRENFQAMQGFHAGHGRSGIGGADGKHGLLERTQAHVACIQT